MPKATCVTDGCDNPRATDQRRCWTCINQRRTPVDKNSPCISCGGPAQGRQCRGCIQRGSCSVVENGSLCTKPHYGSGMCGMHYRRARVHGDPLVTKRPTLGKLMDNLRAAAHATTDDCVFLDSQAGRPAVRLNGTSMEASRAVWIIANGDPGDFHVLHKRHCNGGSGAHGCVNIRHLYLGTNSENLADRASAGVERGENHHGAKLTEEAVREIRTTFVRGNRWSGAGNRAELAAKFGVSETTISYVVHRRNWTWLDDDHSDTSPGDATSSQPISVHET